MITYLAQNQIDKARWDDCIRKSVNRRVYGFSWYLDRVCPGWEALVEDDYAAVFPLTQNRKFRISYLYQPFFAQQLGVFSQEPLTAARVHDFIHAIPGRFRYAEIHLNSMNPPGDMADATLLRVNYEMDLAPEYAVLAAAYAQNTRRNVKKAADHQINVSNTVSPEELVDLFRNNFGKQEGKLKAIHYEVIEGIIRYSLDRGKGFITGAYTHEGILSASAFFLPDGDRYYLLFAASSPEARKNGAMFYLIDRFIAEHSGAPYLLDFEGGNDPDLGRFYRGFGAREVTYPVLKLNRLSKVAETGLNIMRKLRR